MKNRIVRNLLASALVPLAFAAQGASAQSMYSASGAASYEVGAVLPAFGGALAVVGDQVLIGEPQNVMRPGIVYVFERGADGAWAEAQQLRGPDAEVGDGFGATLAADGETVLVGSERGVHAYVRAADGTWQLGGELARPAGLEGNAAFGAALAIEGDVALVGAPGANGRAGAVYVFRQAGGAWSAAGTLAAEGLAPGDAFGGSVALDGGRALVGAPNRGERAGAVFAFESQGGSFSGGTPVETDGVQPNDRLGASLLLAGDVAFASAPFHQRATGMVLRFERGEDGWVQTGRLASFDGGSRDLFGISMAWVDGELWAGSPTRNTAYAFSFDDGGVVTAARKVTADGVAPNAQFAATLAGAGDLAVGGAVAQDYGAGSVVIFERAADGAWTSVAMLDGPPEGFDAVVGSEVSCEGGTAAEWECGDVDLVSFMPVSQLAGEEGARGIETNDNWGWQDPETGRLYALVGMTDRASFVDITDPVNPVHVGILPMTEGANGSSWRDIKTYENHAFIVSDGAGQHGMQVFDLTQLRDFDGEPMVFDEDAVYTRIASAHNIVINEETGFAYSVGSSSGGETCGGGLHIINIQDPKNPTFAGCFADPQTGRASTGYTHDAQCVVYRGPDADYQGREVCFGSNETALSIADVTDKDNTVAISRAAYPNPGYSHQGWLTEDQSYFYMNDELDELSGTVDRTRTIIWDVSDLDDPQLVAEHLGTQESSDHNLYIVGDLMYQSNYQSGLRILDISDPAAPVEVAYFDTVPYGDNSAGFGGSWSNYPFFDTGVVIVTSGNEGLFLVRPTLRNHIF